MLQKMSSPFQLVLKENSCTLDMGLIFTMFEIRILHYNKRTNNGNIECVVYIS